MKFLQIFKQKRIYCGTLFILSLGGLTLAITLNYKYISFKNRILVETKEKFANEIKKATEIIDTKLKSVIQASQDIENFIKTKKPGKKELEKKMKETTATQHYISGLVIGFAPYTFGPKARLYAPYFLKIEKPIEAFKNKEEIVLKKVESIYDYTIPALTHNDPDTRWYLDPLQYGATQWHEPFWGTATQDIVIGFGRTFYKPNKTGTPTSGGVINSILRLKKIQQLVETLNFGKSGYGFILSQKGAFISHPANKIFGKVKNIFELAQEYDNKKLSLLAKKMLQGKTGYDYIWDDLSQKKALIFYQPISSTSWPLVLVIFLDEIFVKYEKQFRQNIIWITLSYLLFIIFLFIFFACFFNLSNKLIWTISLIISTLFIGEIGLIWNLVESFIEEEKHTPVVGNTDVKNYLKIDSIKKDEKVIYVPTGIFIDHVEFNYPNNITLTGNIWQKYYKDVSDNISKKFNFPKSSFSTIEKAYEAQEDYTTIVGWNFVCILPQNLNYHKYPLDYKNFDLQIQQEDIENNVILVPDFDSYLFLTPKSFPGLQKKTILRGWDIEESFFSYETPEVKTTFGLETSSFAQQPQLYFNIVAKRKFIQPFIVRILPLLLVFVLLFICFIIPFSKYFYTMVGMIATLLLTIIILHISLRNFLPIPKFFYLGYLYFIAYLTIIPTIINITIFYRSKNKKVSFLSQVLYWPILFGLFLIITVLVFY